MHGDALSLISGTLSSQMNEQLSKLTKECLTKIEEYKPGPWLPLKKAQCITKITGILIKTNVTPLLTDSKINTSLLFYTHIINTTDATLQWAEQVGYWGRNFEQVEREPVRAAPRNRSDKGQATKRQKVDIDAFPWVQCESILLGVATLIASCTLCQDLKLKHIGTIHTLMSNYILPTVHLDLAETNYITTAIWYIHLLLVYKQLSLYLWLSCE